MKAVLISSTLRQQEQEASKVSKNQDFTKSMHLYPYNAMSLAYVVNRAKQPHLLDIPPIAAYEPFSILQINRKTNQCPNYW